MMAMANPASIARRRPNASAMLPMPSIAKVMSMVNKLTEMPAYLSDQCRSRLR
jgi:hypothetical protein